MRELSRAVRLGVVGLGLLLSGLGAASGHAQTAYPKKHIYPEISAASADITAGLKEAKSTHRRVLLDFGGDWCPDCQVLDINFHSGSNLDLLQKNFVLVHVNVGHMDQNIDLAQRYGVPVDKGVPALAVLDSRGKVLYAQSTGEFRSMRRMDPQSVTDFLNKWKA